MSTKNKRAAIASAIMLVWLGQARPAIAEGEIVGVFRVDIDGVSKTAADKFERSIEEGLTGTGFKVRTRKKLSKALKGAHLEGCYFGACIKRIHERTKIRVLLVARIASVGPNYNFVVSLLDARTGLPTSQVADRCTVCTLEEAIASATLATVALATGTGTAKVTDPVAGPTRAARVSVLRRRIDHLAKRVDKQDKAFLTNRRIGLVFLGLAAVAGGIGTLQVRSCDQRDDVTCWIGAGAGGAFGLAGLSILILSR